MKVKCSTGLLEKPSGNQLGPSPRVCVEPIHKTSITSMTVPSETGGNSSTDFSVNGAGGQVIEINGNNFGEGQL